MTIDVKNFLSNKQSLGTTVATVPSTDVLDLRGATPAAITTNPNLSSFNPLAPAVPAPPFQLTDGRKLDFYIIAASLFAGTGTVTIAPTLQLSTDNSTWDTVETLGPIPAANFQTGDVYKLTANGPAKNASGVAYNYARLAYVLAGTTITVAPVVSAFLQGQ